MNNNKDYYKDDLNKSDYDPNSSDYNKPDESKSANKTNVKLFLTSFYRQISNPINDENAHNKNEIRNRSNDSVVIEKNGGLANKFVLLLLLLWYFCSAITLYTNKYIITSRKVDPTLIGNFIYRINQLFL
jgi:hypothetical protein